MAHALSTFLENSGDVLGEQLVSAAGGGDEAEVERLLRAGAPVDHVIHRYFFAALLVAAEAGLHPSLPSCSREAPPRTRLLPGATRR